MCCRSGASGVAPGRSLTSEWVSSRSKIRSEAAMACCRFVLTRLSFLIGPYIMKAATTNAKKSP